MPDLTEGYPRNKVIVDAIKNRAPLTCRSEPELVKELFINNFMPYAKSRWEYHGTNRNCEDLSSALWATWSHVRDWNHVRNRKAGDLDPRYKGEKVIICDGGLITRAQRVFRGPANGNVRNSSGTLDGRCLFPVHWVLKVGETYFDPTFDRWTLSREDIIERRIRRRSPVLWLTGDSGFLYVRNLNAATGFSDSWNEMKAAGWLSAVDWKTRTARSMHTRSRELMAVDEALGAFEQGGMNAFDALKTAFKQWVDRHPAESTARNAGNCVAGLAGFVGVNVNLPRSSTT